MVEPLVVISSITYILLAYAGLQFFVCLGGKREEVHNIGSEATFFTSLAMVK